MPLETNSGWTAHSGSPPMLPRPLALQHLSRSTRLKQLERGRGLPGPRPGPWLRPRPRGCPGPRPGPWLRPRPRSCPRPCPGPGCALARVAVRVLVRALARARVGTPLGCGITRRIVEFAFPGSVQKALPLVPVEYEHPAVRIIGDAHQNPVGDTRPRRPLHIGIHRSHGNIGAPRNTRTAGNTRPPGNKRAPGATRTFRNTRDDAGKGNLNGAGSVARTLPFLGLRIDAEFLDRGLGDHGRRATPQ